jgi:hypothetical protein
MLLVVFIPSAKRLLKFGSSMKTSDLFNASRGVFIIGRHTDKGSTPTGITPAGEKRAVWSAKNLPKGFVLHLRHPKKPRHSVTAQIVYKEYEGEKGTIQELDSLNFDRYVKDMGAFDNLMASIGDPKVTQDWVAGKYSAKIVDEPAFVGKTILNDVANQFHESEVKGEKNLLVAVTSTGAEGSILKSLGIDPMQFKAKKSLANRSKEKRRVLPQPGDLLRFTEGMLFFVGPNNELIMKFRGRAFRLKKFGSHFVAVKA